MDMSQAKTKITQFMLEHDMTLAKFAERAGVSEGTISRWVNGVVKPNVEHTLKVAEVLGVDFRELL